MRTLTLATLVVALTSRSVRAEDYLNDIWLFSDEVWQNNVNDGEHPDRQLPEDVVRTMSKDAFGKPLAQYSALVALRGVENLTADELSSLMVILSRFVEDNPAAAKLMKRARDEWNRRMANNRRLAEQLRETTDKIDTVFANTPELREVGANAANFGAAILSDIETQFFVQAAQGDARSRSANARGPIYGGRIGSTRRKPFISQVPPMIETSVFLNQYHFCNPATFVVGGTPLNITTFLSNANILAVPQTGPQIGIPQRATAGP